MDIKNIPLGICVAIIFNIFLAVLVERYVFAFLPAFVKWCGTTEQGAGLDVGLIAGALPGGRFLMGFIWGYLVDTFSIKKCAIISGLLLLIATIGFGLSTNVTTAVVLRLVSGLVMGHYVIFQALMSKVCNKDNLAFGTSLTLTARLAGGIVGPASGGVLAFPGDKYQNVFGSSRIFGKYPCLLSSIIVALFCAIGVGLSFFFLPSHNHSQEEEKVNDGESETEEEVGLLQNEPASSQQECSAGNKEEEPSHSSAKKTDSSICAMIEDSKFYQVLSNSGSVRNIRLAGPFSFIVIGFDETFAIYATTAHKYHGTAFSENELGLLMLIEGIITAAIQLAFIPKLDKYFGSQKIVITSSIFLSVFLPLIPATGFIKTSWVMWLCVILVYAFTTLARWAGFFAILCLVTNSVQKEKLGTALALVNVFIAFSRSLSAVVSGDLYSWSLSNVKGINANKHALGFPFDTFFVFFLLAILSIFFGLMSCASFWTKDYSYRHSSTHSEDK